MSQSTFIIDFKNCKNSKEDTAQSYYDSFEFPELKPLKADTYFSSGVNWKIKNKKETSGKFNKSNLEVVVIEACLIKSDLKEILMFSNKMESTYFSYFLDLIKIEVGSEKIVFTKLTDNKK